MSTRLLWALLALSLPLAASAAPEAPTTKTDKVGDKAAEKPAGAPWAAQDSFCKSCNRFTCGIPEIKTVCRSVCQATKVETCAKADFVMPDTHFHDLYQGQFCERGCGNTAHCANTEVSATCHQLCPKDDLQKCDKAKGGPKDSAKTSPKGKSDLPSAIPNPYLVDP